MKLRNLVVFLAAFGVGLSGKAFAQPDQLIGELLVAYAAAAILSSGTNQAPAENASAVKNTLTNTSSEINAKLKSLDSDSARKLAETISKAGEEADALLSSNSVKEDKITALTKILNDGASVVEREAKAASAALDNKKRDEFNANLAAIGKEVHHTTNKLVAELKTIHDSNKLVGTLEDANNQIQDMLHRMKAEYKE